MCKCKESVVLKRYCDLFTQFFIEYIKEDKVESVYVKRFKSQRNDLCTSLLNIFYADFLTVQLLPIRRHEDSCDVFLLPVSMHCEIQSTSKVGHCSWDMNYDWIDQPLSHKMTCYDNFYKSLQQNSTTDAKTYIEDSVIGKNPLLSNAFHYSHKGDASLLSDTEGRMSIKQGVKKTNIIPGQCVIERDNNKSYNILVKCIPITLHAHKCKSCEKELIFICNDLVQKIFCIGVAFEEILDNIEIEAENAQSKEQLRSISHLEGAEGDILSIMKQIETLRGSTLKLQSQFFPGSVGLLSLRHDLAPLLIDDGRIFVAFNKSNNQAYRKGDKGLLERELVAIRVNASELTPELENYYSGIPIIISNESIKRGKEVDFATIHGTESHNFVESWYEYIPILKYIAAQNKIPFLWEFCKSAQSAYNQLDVVDAIERQKIHAKFFKLFKELIHRPFGVEFTKDKNNSLIYVRQICSVAFEASLSRKKRKGEQEVIKITIDNSFVDPIITTVNSINDFLHLDYSALLYGHRRAVNFLAPLYKLLAIELATVTKSEGRCVAREMNIAILTNEVRITITCDNELKEDLLRTGENSEKSGLTGSLMGIASSLNMLKPMFITSEDLPTINYVAFYIISSPAKQKTQIFITLPLHKSE